MGLTLETGISAITVFLQGMISFFSPCVLPLVPLYIGYLAGGAKTLGEDGKMRYKRSVVMRNTLFFVLGVSSTFFILGFGFTALGRFFSDYRSLFTRVGGILIILFGLYQLGVFSSKTLSTEHRLPLRLDKLSMNPLVAFLFGFTFSFAWTPCVGPALGSVLIMATSTSTQAQGFMLIGVYTLGFVLPFLAVGFFTGTLLDLFKKHQKVVRYTVKAGGILMIAIGVMMFTGWMNGFSSYLSGLGAGSIQGGNSASQAQPKPDENASQQEVQSGSDAAKAEKEPAEADTDKDSGENKNPAAPDFTLKDQFGNEHTLSDYKGKVVFLNFWATWCGPCRREMPDIQKLYEDWNLNEDEVVILGVVNPESTEEVQEMMESNGYTYPSVIDPDGSVLAQYGIRAFPTTFMIDKEGGVFGYVEGGLTRDIMDSIVQQTLDGKRK